MIQGGPLAYENPDAASSVRTPVRRRGLQQSHDGELGGQKKTSEHSIQAAESSRMQAYSYAPICRIHISDGGHSLRCNREANPERV